MNSWFPFNSIDCPSYHNPASYIIEVACGEHGDHTRKLVNAIENGKKNIRSDADYEKMSSKIQNDNLPKILSSQDANLKSTYEKNEKFSENINSKALLPAKIMNDIMKGGDNVAISVDADKEPDNTTALLSEETGDLSPERYPTSEFHQFWIVLKRTLLFSRRDWVRISLIVFINFITN